MINRHGFGSALVEVRDRTAVDECAAAGEGDPALVADDEVVENLDAEDLARLAESAGDALIITGRFGIAGRVVVRDDDRAGAVEQCVAEDLVPTITGNSPPTITESPQV